MPVYKIQIAFLNFLCFSLIFLIFLFLMRNGTGLRQQFYCGCQQILFHLRYLYYYIIRGHFKTFIEIGVYFALVLKLPH